MHFTIKMLSLVSLFQLYLSSYQLSLYAVINLWERFPFVFVVVTAYSQYDYGHISRPLGDGTNGTYNWRFKAGLCLLLRNEMLFHLRKHKIFASNASFIIYQVHYWFIVTVIVAFVRPYKKFVHNLTETLLLVLITYAMWSAPLFQSTARFIASSDPTQAYQHFGEIFFQQTSPDKCYDTAPQYKPCEPHVRTME